MVTTSGTDTNDSGVDEMGVGGWWTDITEPKVRVSVDYIPLPNPTSVGSLISLLRRPGHQGFVTLLPSHRALGA